MKVLLTGVAGFIGSHVAQKLLQQGHEVTGLDLLDNYYDPSIKKSNLREIVAGGPDFADKFKFVEGDILDQSQITKLCKDADAVVHLAARVGVRASLAEPKLYQKVNVDGTRSLLDAVLNSGISKIILASSSSVYGGSTRIPFREDDPADNPQSPYAATKRAVELMANDYHKAHGLNITCLRFFTVYGPRQRPDMAISLFTRLIDAGQPIPVFGDGATSRDYTYVDDIVNGTIAAFENTGGFRLYNLGESRTTSLQSLIELIEKCLGKKAIIDRKPLPPGDVLLTNADISLAREEIGYNPQFPIEKGIELYIDWYRKQKQAVS
jgi:UDP-glucuronate 4-epimerase